MRPLRPPPRRGTQQRTFRVARSARRGSAQSFRNVWVVLALLSLLTCAVVVWFMAGAWTSGQASITSATTVGRTPIAHQLTPNPTSSVIPALQPTTRPLQTPASASAGDPPDGLDVTSLKRLMLDLINTDRHAAGLSPVEWDEFAAQVGAAHAQEMADNGYMSHWNLKGYGPDVRYSLAGGNDVTQENVYLYYLRYDDGRGAPIEDWPQVIREAETALMNSPGHRVNILNPDHTHVGIGVAYNAQTGDVRIAQEFVNRHVALQPPPRQARVGDQLEITGDLLPGVTAPTINLAYEPFPRPVTVDDLNNNMPHTYTSPAEFFTAIEPTVSNKHFTAQVTLDDQGRQGLYHVLVFARADGRDVPAADVIIEVH